MSVYVVLIPKVNKYQENGTALPTLEIPFPEYNGWVDNTKSDYFKAVSSIPVDFVKSVIFSKPVADFLPNESTAIRWGSSLDWLYSDFHIMMRDERIYIDDGTDYKVKFFDNCEVFISLKGSVNANFTNCKIYGKHPTVPHIGKPTLTVFRVWDTNTLFENCEFVSMKMFMDSTSAATTNIRGGSLTSCSISGNTDIALSLTNTNMTDVSLESCNVFMTNCDGVVRYKQSKNQTTVPLLAIKNDVSNKLSLVMDKSVRSISVLNYDEKPIPMRFMDRAMGVGLTELNLIGNADIQIDKPFLWTGFIKIGTKKTQINALYASLGFRDSEVLKQHTSKMRENMPKNSDITIDPDMVSIIDFIPDSITINNDPILTLASGLLSIKMSLRPKFLFVPFKIKSKIVYSLYEIMQEQGITKVDDNLLDMVKNILGILFVVFTPRK